MTAAITPQDWLGVIATEYLGPYLASGGSAVKFAVALQPEAGVALRLELSSRAGAAGCLFLEADAARARLHLIHETFFHLAGQVPWSRLCRRVLFDCAARLGYRVPVPDPGGPVTQVLATENGHGLGFIRSELRKEVDLQVFRDGSLARDFRVAMMQLCMAEMEGGEESITTTAVMIDWLTGANRHVSAVRPYSIAATITRSNARYLLGSTLHWVRRAMTGSVIYLDVAALSVARRSGDGAFYYTKAGLLDCYEVLRQFIDDADNLESCLMVVVPSAEFLELDQPTRGMGCYPALKFRVYDEVRDRDLVNPMASLVRVSVAP